MKMKAIALALFIAGASASYALAGDGHGKGKSDSTSTSNSTSTSTTDSHGKSKAKSTACKPSVSFVLNGTFVAAGSDGTSFTMKVTHANHHAQKLGNPATIQTDASTRIVENGKAVKLADLKADDRLNVQARGCKTVPAGTTQSMVAKRVVAHPAGSGETETNETETETTESTTTTSSNG